MAALTLTVTDRAGLKDARNGWGEGWGLAWGGTPELTVARVEQQATAHVREATDRVTLADTAGRALARTFADATGLTDSSLLRLGNTIRLTATDTAGAADPAGTAAGRARGATSQAPLADTTSRAVAYGRGPVDDAGLRDELQRLGQRTVAETVGLSDGAQIERLLLRSADDRMTVTDPGFVGAGSRRAFTDAGGLTDSLAVRAVALDVPGEATVVPVPAGTAVLVAAQVGTATLVLAEFGVGTAAVAPHEWAIATIRQDVSSGGTSKITSAGVTR